MPTLIERISEEQAEELSKKYGNRLGQLDHPTFSLTVTENEARRSRTAEYFVELGLDQDDAEKLVRFITAYLVGPKNFVSTQLKNLVFFLENLSAKYDDREEVELAKQLWVSFFYTGHRWGEVK